MISRYLAVSLLEFNRPSQKLLLANYKGCKVRKELRKNAISQVQAGLSYSQAVREDGLHTKSQPTQNHLQNDMSELKSMMKSDIRTVLST